MPDRTCTCAPEASVVAAAGAVVEQVLALAQRHVPRPEAAHHVADYLRGLLAAVPRKNGWQLAEQVGYAHPRGMQRVLARYVWNADAVRDELRAFVLAELGDPAGILVVDETGFPKQGTHSAGVQRQYCGTLGKIANCQIGVFLSYASPRGHAALDRALYVPQTWLADPGRCRQAGIPSDLRFQTKPQLAQAMLARVWAAGVAAVWVTGDEIYGSDGHFRRALEKHGQAYVLAVRGAEQPTTWPPCAPPGQAAVTELVAALPDDAWHRLSCGEGAQGPRIYDWAAMPLRPALTDAWQHTLLVRRPPGHPADLAYYLVYAPTATSLAELVRVAGARWTIEEVFKQAKGQVGLDQYEVRSYQGWYRHITLALLALSALAVGAATKGGPSVPSTSPSPSPNSVVSSSASSGPSPIRHRSSSPGPAGAATISVSPKPPIAAAA